MATKAKTITLTHFPFYVPAGDQEPRWKVEAVTDSTDFNPGQLLKKNEVDALCAAPDWKVTIRGIK